MQGMTNMDKCTIEQKANEVLNKYSDCVKENSFVEIIEIAKRMGFVVVQGDLGEYDGFIISSKTDRKIAGVTTKKIIAVNEKRDYNFKRFIIAHELGHYCFSKNKDLVEHREHRTGKSEEENEMDYFAACLLMPEDKFKETVDKYEKLGFKTNVLPLLMAKSCGVTIKTSTRRFEELDLLD